MNTGLWMYGIAEQIALQEQRLAPEEAATSRDEQFAALVRRQARFVFRVAYSVLRDVQDAEDAVQETFLRIHRRSPVWAEITDERAFLATIAWRIALDQRRKAPKRATDCDAPWAGLNPEQAAIASDWSSVVHRLIDALPEELRQPLVLSGIEELSSCEIAKMMGIAEGTVRTRVMRARQILRQKLSALKARRHDR
jgi:RNA polymerase sigma-70 factor (ECF subfamily)